MNTEKRAEIEYEEGSGNIFSDLGLEDADELFARSQIGYYVFKLLDNKKLKQREAAALLGIAQSDVSHLMNGQFTRFTIDKLLTFLEKLDQKVTIQIEPHRPGEPYRAVDLVHPRYLRPAVPRMRAARKVAK